jgi:hypothetical protein
MKNLLLATVVRTTAAIAQASSNKSFLQCLEAALDNDASYYSLPQDLLF